MKIDAHQHYWKLDRGDYGWLTPELTVLYRDFLPKDLSTELKQEGIVGTVVVQAAPTEEETKYLLHLSECDSTIKGVVGWLNLEDPDFQTIFDGFHEHPKFVGVRPMIHDIKEENWMLRPEVVRSISYMAQKDVPLDLLVRPCHLPSVLELLKRVPDLKAVIDHIAKPEIARGQWDPWARQIEQLAENYSNLYCKLSGMVTEANHSTWTYYDLVPYVEHVVNCFGTERLMFGSDWPVCLMAVSGYGKVLRALEQSLPSSLNDNQKARIFGGNAIDFYKLNV